MTNFTCFHHICEIISLVKKRFCFSAAKPNNTHITLTPRKVVVGEEVIIDCTSHGVPEPSYKITHIDTKTVRNVKTFTISEAKLSDAGGYECIAWNKVGNDSDSDNLTVVGKTRFLHALLPHHGQKHIRKEHEKESECSVGIRLIINK